MRMKKLKTEAEVSAYVDANYGKSSAKALDICGSWEKAKPVVSFIFSMPMLPNRWKAVYVALAAVLDGFCQEMQE